MELRELRVVSLPGIESPFTITGEPGLNLVVGPNGAGKSSLARAAIGLLWPDPDLTGHIVSATWAIDGESWHAERAGGPAVAWQHDGRPTEPPALVTARQAGVYRLGVLDLLKAAADHTDDGLATEIRRQLAGGVDLAALRKQFGWTGHEGRGDAQSLVEVRTRISDLHEKQRQLADEESRLDELGEQLEEAVAAAGRREALQAGRDLAAAMRALQDAADGAAVYPAVMAELRGDEDTRLAALIERRDGAAAEIAAAETAQARAERDRATADLADGGPDEATLEVLRQYLGEARELATDLRRIEEDVAAAAATVEQTREQLGDLEPPADNPVSIEAAGLAIERLRNRDGERAVRDGLDRLLARDDLGRESTAAAEPATLETARKALGDWLAATAPPPSWPLRLLPWLATGGLIALGGVLQPWQTGVWPGWMALALGALLLPAWLLLRRRSYRDQARRQTEARAVFASTELPEPESWTRSTVASALRGLLSQEAAAAQARLRDQLRLALQGERDQAAGRLGEDDPAGELDQAQLLQRVAAWHGAVAARSAAERRRDQTAERLAAVRTELAGRLATWWRGDASEIATLTAAVTDLERRRQAHADAMTRLEGAHDQHDAAGKRLEAAAVELAALLGRLDLVEDEAAAAIADLLGRRDAYLAARAEVDRRTIERDRCRRLIDELPELQAERARGALDLSTTELDAAIEDAAARAARADDLRRQITEIRTRIDTARSDVQLSDARTGEEALVSKLGTVRDTVRGNALATLLLTRAATRYEAATEPPLLKRTQELFARFTDGRYGLTVVEDGPDQPASFRAQDSATGRGLALGELSDGTRAQLLLAARLAALPEHERGVRPPLFLDESLTASDAVRFEAIAKALLDLVRREGRQLFYLTCDPADVTAWQNLLAAGGGEPAPVIDLAAIRRLAARTPTERLRPDAPHAVPVPDDDAAAYGELLEVPPLGVGLEVDGVHLFHLLRDDLPLLHGLLRRRIDGYGELRLLADDLVADGALDTVARERLEARARAMTAFLDAFATGRGRPIPPGIIEHTSGIKTSKLAEIDALAVAHAGDAAALVAALADGGVKGLQQAKKDEIADWLTAGGYLDRRSVLEREEVRRRTIRALRSDLGGGNIDWETIDLLIDAWWVAAGGDR